MMPSATQVKTVRSLLRRKATWEMDAEELARVVADHKGWASAEGGWIYTASGKPIVQGRSGLARRLEAKRAIVVGKGIIWSRIH